jgi:hypothetical protein
MPVFSDVDTADESLHWSFQPIGQPEPQVGSQKLHPIDSFIQARLDAKKLNHSPPANRKTLIRRLYHDLLGLKPTFNQVNNFLNDKRPEAYSYLVDELLASTHFGERWGRHWLDVARYADTKGYLPGKKNRLYPFAYTYRDWVIRVMNQDMPYDQFIRNQLAADFLVDKSNHPDLAALGFLTVGPRFLDRRQLIIDDRIDVVTRGLMGFTVACARCHDHFHDPIPQEDYYSLYGIFNLSSQPEVLPLIGQPDINSTEYLEFSEKLTRLELVVEEHVQKKLIYAQSEDGILAYLQVFWDGLRLSQNDFEVMVAKRKLFPKLAHRWRNYIEGKKKLEKSFLSPLLLLTSSKDPAKLLNDWNKKLNPSFPSFFTMSFKKGNIKTVEGVLRLYANVMSQAIQQKDNSKTKKGIIVAVSAREFPVNLNTKEFRKYFDTKAGDKNNQLRAEVAKHEAEHPGSPPRAMSLVDSPNIRDPQIFLRGDFGNRGERVPRRFLVALTPSDGTRKNYSQGSGRLELAESIVSPDNPLTARVMVNRVWRHLVGRGLARTPSDFGLMGEKPTHPLLLDYLANSFMKNGWSLKNLIRQIVHSRTYRQSSHNLNPADPENRLLTSMNPKRLGYEAMHDGMLQVSGELDPRMGGAPKPPGKKPLSTRRAVYGFIDRQNIAPILNTFDFANPNIHSPQRLETTVPQQALFALNDPFVLARANRLAEYAGKQYPAPVQAEKVAQFLYRKILSRNPQPEELETVVSFLTPQVTVPKMEDLAQTLLVSNEFFFVD